MANPLMNNHKMITFAVPDMMKNARFSVPRPVQEACRKSWMPAVLLGFSGVPVSCDSLKNWTGKSVFCCGVLSCGSLSNLEVKICVAS